MLSMLERKELPNSLISKLRRKKKKQISNWLMQKRSKPSLENRLFWKRLKRPNKKLNNKSEQAVSQSSLLMKKLRKHFMECLLLTRKCSQISLIIWKIWSIISQRRMKTTIWSRLISTPPWLPISKMGIKKKSNRICFKLGWSFFSNLSITITKGDKLWTQFQHRSYLL